jgi:NAD-dependent deacetylase
MKKKLVVLTGAGMSAESGISTFRDAGGLWEGHDIQEVASPQGWFRNKALVLDFYNKRRAQLKTVSPNPGHLALAQAEQDFDVVIITQNVDNLHERAGSSKVIHLHGELTKVRSERSEHLVYEWHDDLHIGQLASDGHQLRPHIVWFGEQVPLLEKAAQEVDEADILLIIGTSLQVYPAASLYHYAPENCPIIYIDPNPASLENTNRDKIQIVQASAGEGVPLVLEGLKR